ncbi:hypothetical protein DFJ73DRAFT_840617 [Zopfochytrium polystomum]|nr:hypothetical protein DFJ73DRAFT_840617 [Zopfochytrium polystomum]
MYIHVRQKHKKQAMSLVMRKAVAAASLASVVLSCYPSAASTAFARRSDLVGAYGGGAAAKEQGGDRSLNLGSLISVSSALVQGTSCTASAYTGTLCPASIMTYSTSVTADQQESVESVLSTTVATLATVKDRDPICYNDLLALACTQAFPNCANGVTQLPCLSACSTSLSACTATFESIGLLSLLQTNLANCTQLSSSNTEKYPTTACYNSPVIKAASSSGSTSTGSITCPRFFKPATNLTNYQTSNNCAKSGCCVPCPVQDYFYPVGSFNNVLTISIVLHAISAALMAYVVVSWAVLPGRRTHPGDIVLHFCVCITLWMGTTLFTIGNPKRIQCYDDITVATASNSTICGAMAACLMLFIHGGVFWAGYMIFNLHATIVWRSSIFERYKPLGVVVCWGVPGILTFIPFLIDHVDASTGLNCLIGPQHANALFFGADAVIVIPAFFINFATMIHIMMVTRNNASSTASGGISSNGAYGGPNSIPKPLSARRQILILLKLNWRAMLLGLVFILVYVTYFVFFNVVVLPTSNTNSDTPWIQSWSQCVLTATSTDNAVVQNDCANKHSADLPSFGVLVLANMITSSVGIFTFFIFGFNMQLLYDWAAICVGSRRTRMGSGEFEMKVQNDAEWR